MFFLQAMKLLTRTSEVSEMSVSDTATPKSKRSIDDITVERCSTTKKICLKPVKLEKLDEKNDENEEDEKKSGVNNEVNENPEPDYSEYAGL